jgi:hypothetical protein
VVKGRFEDTILTLPVGLREKMEKPQTALVSVDILT